MLLHEYRTQLSDQLGAFERPSIAPMSADVYMASSILQKALRRADRKFAHAAAALLLSVDPGRFWRRLVATVCEDFGLSDLELTKQVIAAAADGGWRRRVGGDNAVAGYLINRLVTKPRDRRVDETYMAAVVISRAPDPEIMIGSQNLCPQLIHLLGQATAIVLRCEQASGFRGHRVLVAPQCDRELARMGELGWADPNLIMACKQARRTSKCLLPVLLPLLKAETERVGKAPAVVRHDVPAAIEINGLPSYAIDGYTQPGRAALVRLVHRHRGLQKILVGLRGYKARMDALTSLLFVSEGGICTSELSDPLYDGLKSHSLGCWSGLAKAALADGVEIMRAAIPALNSIRAEVMGSGAWTP